MTVSTVSSRAHRSTEPLANCNSQLTALTNGVIPHNRMIVQSKNVSFGAVERGRSAHDVDAGSFSGAWAASQMHTGCI